MAALFDLPIISAGKPLSAGLRLLRSAKLHALVVSGVGGALRLVTSQDILRAKSKGARYLKEVRNGFIVAKPAMSPVRKRDLLANESHWLELFGRSRARFIAVGRSGSRQTLISRSEEYAKTVSAGAACICSGCDHCEDSPPASQGGRCPHCTQGRFDCY